ncbi:MAG: 4Fe-4S ferredoxin [Deltaproteobacteria bacterium HGW-Deltaproteobacteria-19]|jgi:NAD-dependent dihydropyrimidine dehydrogenase PreA subunit|nr:MAG: 4Fe-4S ferredoxin [Deltaproteobacteria bacterium HGW-Deltaproteobacteria-19]
MEEVYAKLAKHLDRLPIPYPETESGIEREILARWFSPREAEIALAMTGLPEAVPAIAARLGTEAEPLAPVLEDMSKRGLIFRIAKGEKRFYNLVPLAEGMWEFHIHQNNVEDVRLLRKYFDEFMTKGWYGTKTSQHRIVPIAQSITPDMEVLPYEQAEALIRAQAKISVATCICRKEEKMVGEGCDHPTETCMAFGAGAFFYIQNGLGREVSNEEALQILRKAMDSGLVLQPGNGQKVWNLCMCCGCCCALLRTLKRMDRPAEVAHTNFRSRVIPEECTNCGICEGRCPMDAIRIEETAMVNPDRCIGCGVCVGSCPFDAIKLDYKNPQERYTPPRDVMEMQLTIARERGLL